jgi:ribosomal-protein-alanine N-acetyltransferase
MSDKESLKVLCNTVDRQYLSDRLPSPYTDSDAEWWINKVTEAECKTGLFRAVVVNGQVVGSISVECREDVYRIDGELGYMLLTDHWSQGIMTQAVAQITHLAFELLDIQRITAHAFAPDIASARVLEKNGYEKEATIRKGAIKNGEIHTIVQYGWVK